MKNEVSSDKPYDCTQVRSHLQAFDKSIIALRVASNKIATIMEEKENRENLLIHELLLYQRNVLHDQMDIIIKSKNKYSSKILRYRKIIEN